MASGAEHAGGGFPVDPLHQFIVQPIIPIHIGGFDASFTNSSLWMVVTVISVFAFSFFAVRSRAMVPGRMQSAVEMVYQFIADMVRDSAGHDAQRFFPFIFSLFMFILFANLIGLFPYAFTVTSHIIVTFALASFIFIAVTILGFAVHGFHFLRFFVPKGVPVALLPLLVVIEVISYLTRPISLSVRLFANMMAGHTMLKVFAGFVIAMGWLGGFLPLAFMVAFTGLEILVAFLQAYVFAILTCIYLNDALHMH